MSHGACTDQCIGYFQMGSLSPSALSSPLALLPHPPAGWLWTASAEGTPYVLVNQSSGGDVALGHPQIQCCLTQHAQCLHYDWFKKGLDSR